MAATTITSSPIRELQLEGRARLLVLADARRAVALRRDAPRAVVLTDAAALERLEGEFDAAVIDGLLESEPWDRWVLQRVHRVLRINAPILVVVPGLMSPASAIDLRFLAYASRKVFERLMQRLTPGFQLPGAVHRRYHMPRLVRTMEQLGYTSIEEAPAPGRRSALTARKASSLSGIQGRGWPDADAHRRRYAEQYASLLAARVAWLSAFPEFQGVRPQPLDASEWRGCRVLVLAPHPDDELIGCGGTLCRLSSAGAEIAILQATDGRGLRSLRDLPEARRKSVRLEEASRVAAALGAELVLWRREDGRLRCCAETVGELARLLVKLRPTHVFTPFLGDPHADHLALSRILGEALCAARLEPQILQYEVWSLVPVNLYCDITDRVQALESLLLLYERAMRADDFVHFCESRNLANALYLTGRPGYLEAFLSTTGAQYVQLLRRSQPALQPATQAG